MSESCLKLSMSKGFHNWTTRVKFFCWTKILTFWKFVLFCSKHQVWWVLRFSYHILLISLCPAHQFSRKLLPMSICNLVSTKCCCTTSLWKDYGRKKSCHASKHLHHFQRVAIRNFVITTFSAQTCHLNVLFSMTKVLILHFRQTQCLKITEKRVGKVQWTAKNGQFDDFLKIWSRVKQSCQTGQY